MNNLRRPEERNNARKRVESWEYHRSLEDRRSPIKRTISFIENSLLADNRTSRILFKYSHRTSTWHTWLLASFSAWCGSILYYINYKINV